MFNDSKYYLDELGYFDGNEEKKQGGPYLLFVLGALLIIVTIFFSVSAFTRKGGTLE